DGTFTKEQIKGKQQEIRDSLRATEGRIAVLSEIVTPAPRAEEFRGLLTVWAKMTAAEKRKALGHIIDHIKVYRTEGQQPNRIEIIPRWAPLEMRLAGQLSA